MNYLSHFALDEYRQDKAFSVGGALPDLARLRGQGFRLKPGQLTEEAVLTPIQQRLEAGIARHYAIDAAWHGSARFEHLEALVRQALQEAGITGLLRTSFAAHIGAEMLLDRALLRQDLQLAARFYACFTEEILEEVYALVSLKGQSVWIERLRKGIDQFVQRRFLADYAGNYLARAWPGVYTHVTGDAVAQAYSGLRWQQVIDAIDAQEWRLDFEV